jgi:hypothetical protein
MKNRRSPKLKLRRSKRHIERSSDCVPDIPIVEISVAPVMSSNILGLEVVGIVLVVVCGSVSAVRTVGGHQGDVVQVGGVRVQSRRRLYGNVNGGIDDGEVSRIKDRPKRDMRTSMTTGQETCRGRCLKQPERFCGVSPDSGLPSWCLSELIHSQSKVLVRLLSMAAG